MNNQHDDFFKRNQAAQIAAVQMQDVPVKRSARKPLTDREITSLMVNHDFDSTYRDRIHSLIKAVELVHGIGEE